MKGRLILRAALGAALFMTLISIFPAAQAVRDVHMKGVVTRSGRPVRSAWVIITQNGDEKGRTLTGDNGKYYIGELSAGEYEVVVEQGPRQLCTRHVKLPDDSAFDIEVTRH